MASHMTELIKLHTLDKCRLLVQITYISLKKKRRLEVLLARARLRLEMLPGAAAALGACRTASCRTAMR